MHQKLAKSAAELESMITAELREHPEGESAGVGVIRPTGGATWDAVLIREVPQTNDACQAKLAEITSRIREEFDLSE
jgi:hypothetical protein